MDTLWVGHDPSYAVTVRQEINRSLGAHGIPSPLADDVLLVASELFGNSVQHASALRDGDLQVTWHVDDRNVTLRVTDGGGRELPHVVHAGPDAPSGRGLQIVDALAVRWGVESGPDGATTVWAVLGVS